MWLFITAVFLVAVWLLYKWPQKTMRGFVIALLVVMGLVAAVGIFSYLESIDNERRWRAVQADEANVVVKASYDGIKCTRDKPLYVFIGNASSKILNAVRWDLEAYVPGHSTNVVDILAEGYKSDAILKPKQGISYCYPLPKLSANVDPTSLEFKVAHPEIRFADEH